MTNSFIFYRSYFEAISDLEMIDKVYLYEAIANYSLNDVEPKLTGVNATIWKLIKPQIDSNKKKRADGSKGGRPPKETTGYEDEKPPVIDEDNQRLSDKKPNGNVNVNANVDDNGKGNENVKSNKKIPIEERKEKFYHECGTYLMVDGLLTPNEPKIENRRYPKDMLRLFYNYWSEMDAKGKKMRFEMERTFQIANRLVTWYNRDKAKYDAMYQTPKLPEGWWNMDLTPEQMKLVPPEKLQEKKNHDTRRRMGI